MKDIVRAPHVSRKMSLNVDLRAAALRDISWSGQHLELRTWESSVFEGVQALD